MPVFRVTVNQTLEAQTIMNVYHLAHSSDTTFDDTDAQTFADMLDLIKTDLSSSVTLNFLEYRRVDISGTSGVLYTPTGWPDTGDATGATLPSFCAMLITGIASGQPKPRRFRKYFGAILEADSTGSLWAASGDTRRAAIAGRHQTYNDGTATWKMAAVSYKDFATGIIEDNVGDRWNLITDFTSSDVVAHMTSRKIGRGM